MGSFCLSLIPLLPGYMARGRFNVSCHGWVFLCFVHFLFHSSLNFDWVILAFLCPVGSRGVHPSAKRNFSWVLFDKIRYPFLSHHKKSIQFNFQVQFSNTIWKIEREPWIKNYPPIEWCRISFRYSWHDLFMHNSFLRNLIAFLWDPRTPSAKLCSVHLRL